MTDKKIAVHVTNEEQWDEVREHYKMNRKFLWESMPEGVTTVIETGKYAIVDYVKSHFNEYELLEFNEWQARIKEDSMEKIEVPQAVYDEFNMLNGARSTAFSVFTDVWSRDIQDDIWEYIFGSGNKAKQHQLNLAKVMAGEAEFVPVEEAYYWRDKQEKWLGYTDSNVSTIELFGDFDLRTKITETEIREKTSFDIDKLKKVSE